MICMLVRTSLLCFAQIIAFVIRLFLSLLILKKLCTIAFNKLIEMFLFSCLSYRTNRFDFTTVIHQTSYCGLLLFFPVHFVICRSLYNRQWQNGVYQLNGKGEGVDLKRVSPTFQVVRVELRVMFVKQIYSENHSILKY